jgi:hypothetical protein
MDADRGDLRLPHPDPHVLLPLPPLGRDAKVGEGADQHLLEVLHIAPDIAPVGRKVDDGIAHQLPRPVVGHVAAPVGLHHLHAACPQRFLA